MDATGYILAGGRECVIFQINDDHSRMELVSRVAWSESCDDAIAAFNAAVAKYGVSQRLLTDNHLAFNPTWVHRPVDHPRQPYGRGGDHR